MEPSGTEHLIAVSYRLHIDTLSFFEQCTGINYPTPHYVPH